MEAGAIHFNKSNHMDFNRWIYEGIPYVQGVIRLYINFKSWYPGTEEKRLHEEMFPELKTEIPESKEITLKKHSDIEFVQNVLKALEVWFGADFYYYYYYHLHFCYTKMITLITYLVYI